MDLQQCLCFATDWSELWRLNLQAHKSRFWSGFLEVLFSKTPSIVKFMWRSVTDESASGFCRTTLKSKNYCARKKNCPYVTLSISKPVRTDLISKPNLGLTAPTIVRLSYGTLFCGHFEGSLWRSPSTEGQNLYALIQFLFIFSNFWSCIMSTFGKSGFIIT